MGRRIGDYFSYFNNFYIIVFCGVFLCFLWGIFCFVLLLLFVCLFCF